MLSRDCLRLVSYAISSQNRQESRTYIIEGVLFYSSRCVTAFYFFYKYNQSTKEYIPFSQLKISEQ